MAGFVLGHLVALYYGTVPVWPIWWSQTGMYEHPFPYHFLFAMTGLCTAGAFLHENDARRYWSKSLANVFGCASVLCFAGMSVINSTAQPWVVIHGAPASLSGIFMAAFATLRTYEMAAPTPRGQRPLVLEPWVQIPLTFCMMVFMEKLFKWIAVGAALGFNLNGTYSTVQAVFIRSSSVMQWAQLQFMGLLTERITFAR